MNKKQRIILIVIGILIILLLIAIAMLMKIKKEQKQSGENEYDFIEEIVDKNIRLVKNHNQYYSILDCITKYYMSIGKKDTSVYNMLAKEYISDNNITISNVLEKLELVNTEEPYYKIKEMYTQDGNIVAIYYVYGQLKEDMFEDEKIDTYFIVYVDNANVTYAISPITKEEYEKRIIKGTELKNEEIAKNENNKYNSMIVNDETITTQLLYDYKSKAMDNIEEAYAKLEEAYREKRFGDINRYKEYIDNSNTKYAVLSQYQKTDKGDYIQYVCIDQNGNYYIFKETAVMNYTVILDTYTLELPEFIERYNQATEEEKVALNIQKIFNAIKEKDYKYVYDKLDNTFKANNFRTQDMLKEYIEEKLYNENTIEYVSCDKNADIYIYKIKVRNKKDANAHEINMKMVMQLKQGTDFVTSFSIE